MFLELSKQTPCLGFPQNVPASSSSSTHGRQPANLFPDRSQRALTREHEKPDLLFSPPLFQTETQSSISKHQGAPQCCTSIFGRHCIAVIHCRICWPAALSQHSWMREVPILVPALSSVCTEPTEQCKVKSHLSSKILNHGIRESKYSGSTQILCFIFSIHLLRPSKIRGEAASHLCH